VDLSPYIWGQNPGGGDSKTQSALKGALAIVDGATTHDDEGDKGTLTAQRSSKTEKFLKVIGEEVRDD